MTAKTMTHTPGPWRVSGFRAVVDAKNAKIGIALADEVTKGEARANARLIAAAPELLEAAKDVLGFVMTITGSPSAAATLASHKASRLRLDGTTQNLNELEAAIRVAINKATGTESEGGTG